MRHIRGARLLTPKHLGAPSVGRASFFATQPLIWINWLQLAVV
jgi:hypothetical protein